MSMRVLNTKACVHPSLYRPLQTKKIVIEAPCITAFLSKFRAFGAKKFYYTCNATHARAVTQYIYTLPAAMIHISPEWRGKRY
jgi:hypothetical protein